MRSFSVIGLVGLLLCGVRAALAHEDLHQHQHQHQDVEKEKEEVVMPPLHEQEFRQDSNEELERKWGFEVCVWSVLMLFCQYASIIAARLSESISELSRTYIAV